MTAALPAEQRRLTHTRAELMSQARSCSTADFDTRAGAVLIHSHTLGRILDDITTKPVAPAEWQRLIIGIIERVLT